MPAARTERYRRGARTVVAEAPHLLRRTNKGASGAVPAEAGDAVEARGERQARSEGVRAADEPMAAAPRVAACRCGSTPLGRAAEHDRSWCMPRPRANSARHLEMRLVRALTSRSWATSAAVLGRAGFFSSLSGAAAGASVGAGSESAPFSTLTRFAAGFAMTI